MNRTSRFRALVLALSCMFMPSLLSADVSVFSNLNSNAENGGYVINDTGTGSTEALAAAFTPSGDYVLTGAEAGLNSSSTGGGVVGFAVYSDDGGLPGTLLAALQPVTLSANASEFVSTGNPSSAIDLLSGDQYWLVLTPGSDTSVNWDPDGTSTVSTAATNDASGASGWKTTSSDNVAFAIYGTPLVPVPEPRELGPAAILMLILVVVRHRVSARV